jgi:hypothetical protein
MAIAGFMAAAAAESSRMRRVGLARRVVVFIAAIAFALQSYITQTHIHHGSQGFGDSVKIAAAQSPAHGKTHPANDPADCPFCQAAIHAGVFVASAPPLLHLPFMWIETVALTYTATAASVTSAHDWQSRAPPRL